MKTKREIFRYIAKRFEDKDNPSKHGICLEIWTLYYDNKITGKQKDNMLQIIIDIRRDYNLMTYFWPFKVNNTPRAKLCRLIANNAPEEKYRELFTKYPPNTYPIHNQTKE